MAGVGFIKLYRKLLDNPVVCKDADHLAVWVYLLLQATFDRQEKMFEGHVITLMPGQLITGRRAISCDIKLDASKVQRILKTFEIEHLIEQQTTPRNRLISVLNWNEYQSSEQQTAQQVNNNCTTSEQQLNQLQECKERKKEKKDKKESPLSPKSAYGSQNNVMLTRDELDRLRDKYPADADDAIEYFSCYIVEKNYKSASHNMAIQRWVINAVKEKKAREGNQLPLNGFMKKSMSEAERIMNIREDD